jgi:hypothetical protein
MKWSRSALACAAALAALSLSWLATPPAKATTTVTSTWVDGATFNTNKECLGVLGGDMTNGTPVVIWACNGHPDQTWQISAVPGSSGPLQIRNSQNLNKCLGVLGSATSDGSKLVIWDCNGHTDQNWQFMPWTPDSLNAPFGCFNIQNQNAAPKVLGVLGGNIADGSQTVIWDSLTGITHHDQVWCPE